MNQSRPILLYDGSCGFCQQSVQFILQHERAEDIYFAPLESELSKQILETHPHLLNFDSIVFFKGNKPFVESDAVFELASYLQKPYYLGKYIRLVPKKIRDRLYRFIAKHRHRLIRNNHMCLLPTAQQRKRFLN
ncbi:MAG: thiol-disulfide oxidoreductase DCC family protein [Paenisporosarcina sp.]